MTTTKIQIVKLSGKQEPIVRRRAQCVARLNDQAALLADPSYQRVLVRWSGKGVNRKSTEKKLPVRSWAKQQLNGVEFRLRFLPDGQGIVVADMAALPAAIEQLVEQIKAGELDALITPVKKVKAAGKGKTLDLSKKPGASADRAKLSAVAGRRATA